MLAAAVDQLSMLVWMTRAVNVRHPGKPPKRLPRPGSRLEKVTNPAREIPQGLPVIDLTKEGSHGD